MKFFCSFCKPNTATDSNNKPTTDLPPIAPQAVTTIHLTSSIYTTNSTINWDDPATKNLLYAKGKQDTNIENYEFLYDCYRMKNIVQNSTINSDEKDRMTRLLATELFPKHITDEVADLIVYYVTINNQPERVRCAINISGDLRSQFKELHKAIDEASHQTILSLYESAAEDIIKSLELPAKQARTGRSGLSFKLSINTNFFSQQSSSISSPSKRRERAVSDILWARTDNTNDI
ncbi:MAG: hypothetical protein WC627_00020 [Legionella sp.]|jgi:hypothetical protein